MPKKFCFLHVFLDLFYLIFINKNVIMTFTEPPQIKRHSDSEYSAPKRKRRCGACGEEGVCFVSNYLVWLHSYCI